MDLYTPINKVLEDMTTPWVFTQINLPYENIVNNGIILWCVDNIRGRWTLASQNKFGFESGEDALMFRIKYGFAT